MIAITKSGTGLLFTNTTGNIQYLPTPTVEYKVGIPGQTFDSVLFRSGDQLVAVNVATISTIGPNPPGAIPGDIIGQLTTLLGAGSSAPIALSSGGHLQVLTSTTDGTAFVQFPSQACSRLIIVNDTGVQIDVRQDPLGSHLPVMVGTSQVFQGITNANQLRVCRHDFSTAQVIIHARWEV